MTEAEGHHKMNSAAVSFFLELIQIFKRFDLDKNWKCIGSL